jgi:hypothetical protein
MPEPLRSGRTWVRAAPDGQTEITDGANLSWWVCDEDDQTVVGRFKTIPPEYDDVAIYAMGMERVAYVLGARLGLPIPPTYLEEVEGHIGCVTMKAGGPNSLRYSWAMGRAPMMGNDVINSCLWPVAVAFDVLIANVDRSADNIILDPVPPETRPGAAYRSTSWLIDHEKSGLWWPRKIDPTVGLDVEALEINDGSMTAEGDGYFRGALMPAEYKASFADLDAEDREPHLNAIRQLTEDDLRAAVAEVPEEFMTPKAKELTVRFLAARLDAIATLTRDVFPIP